MQIKNRKKAIWITLGVIVGIPLAILLLVIVGFLFIMLEMDAFSTVLPTVTYGEFPIKVVYEVAGEQKVLEDVVVCKFGGFGPLTEAGKFRKWSAYLKSGAERLTLLKIDENSELYCWYGDPRYYMGEIKEEVWGEPRQKGDYKPRTVDFQEKQADGSIKDISIPAEEAWEKYQLRVLNIHFSDPIENSFKLWGIFPN